MLENQIIFVFQHLSAGKVTNLQVLLRLALITGLAPSPRRLHARRDDWRPGQVVARLGHRNVDTVHHVRHALALQGMT